MHAAWSQQTGKEGEEERMMIYRYLLTVLIVFVAHFSLPVFAEEDSKLLRDKGDVGLDLQILVIGVSPIGFPAFYGTWNLEQEHQLEVGAGFDGCDWENFALNYRYFLSPQSRWSSVFYGGFSYSRGTSYCVISDSDYYKEDLYWANIGWGYNYTSPDGFRFETGIALPLLFSNEGLPFLPSWNVARIGRVW